LGDRSGNLVEFLWLKKEVFDRSGRVEPRESRLDQEDRKFLKSFQTQAAISLLGAPALVPGDRERRAKGEAVDSSRLAARVVKTFLLPADHWLAYSMKSIAWLENKESVVFTISNFNLTYRVRHSARR
jgi:hypothetical protein